MVPAKHTAQHPDPPQQEVPVRRDLVPCRVFARISPAARSAGCLCGLVLDKTFGPGHETLSKAAWINGGSPTDGFLSHAPKGPFAGFYNNIAGNAWGDWLFMAALAGIGIALTLGITMRIAAAAGATLLVMMWSAVLPRRTIRSWTTTLSTQSSWCCSRSRRLARLWALAGGGSRSRWCPDMAP